jgi:transcriptional regulator with XRE-family HTH domain
MAFQRLEDLRKDYGKTQKEIAELLHCNREVYRRYEKGIHELPIWVLMQLADYYNTSTDYLLGRTNNPKPPEK